MAPGAALAFLLAAVVAGETPAAQPFRDPTRDGYAETGGGVTNLYSQEMLLRCVGDSGSDGLAFDIAREAKLLDGGTIDPRQVVGRAWIAPYPLAGSETRWDVYQFLASSTIREGRATLPIARLKNESDKDWSRRGQIVVRLELGLAQDGPDRPLGTYEFLAGFSKEGEIYRRAVTVTEGPSVGLIRSDSPDRIVISLRTEPDAPAFVEVWEAGGGSGAVGSVRRFDSPVSRKHEIQVVDLHPGTDYLYRIGTAGWTSAPYAFRTAPPKGKGRVRFAFGGDSRQGVGGGAKAFMGVDAQIVERELQEAWRRDAAFWIQGGDLVNGYTTEIEDFRSQFRAFKWAASSFLHERPIYAGVGNHDAAIRIFEKGASGSESHQDVVLDRWPYETESSESIFADEFVNPENGPAPADSRRPSYGETVYSFQYGPVLVIVLNNNYWVSTDPERFGGAPEGWFFPDQMAWLQRELERAEGDPTVHHVLLCMHEPVFPNGAHLDDAMWYLGDNRVRGFSVDSASGELRPAGPGLIEVRNDLVRMAARMGKVAAILTSDEHSYSRILITPETPAGDPARDDRDGDGKLDAGGYSVIPGLSRPVWCVISGGGGAPNYAEEESPWNSWWKAHPESCAAREGCYRFSMLYHWLLFDADEESIALEVYSDRGELIDRVADLTAAAR
jgi:hypothetical protein